LFIDFGWELEGAVDALAESAGKVEDTQFIYYYCKSVTSCKMKKTKRNKI
jgi:hypothetical protein